MYVCTTDKGDDGQTHSAVRVGAPIQQYVHKWTNKRTPHPDGPAVCVSCNAT
jgi:hypothetical protein